MQQVDSITAHFHSNVCYGISNRCNWSPRVGVFKLQNYYRLQIDEEVARLCSKFLKYLPYPSRIYVLEMMRWWNNINLFESNGQNHGYETRNRSALRSDNQLRDYRYSQEYCSLFRNKLSCKCKEYQQSWHIFQCLWSPFWNWSVVW